MRAGRGASLKPSPKAPTLTPTRLERAQGGERPRAQPYAAERAWRQVKRRLVRLVDLALEIEPAPLEVAPVAQQLLEVERGGA